MLRLFQTLEYVDKFFESFDLGMQYHSLFISVTNPPAYSFMEKKTEEKTTYRSKRENRTQERGHIKNSISYDCKSNIQVVG